MQQNNKNLLGESLGQIIAIVAFVLIIAFGIFGSLFLASAVPGAFSGVASAITSVFTPQNTSSGENTTNDSTDNTTPATPDTTQSLTVSGPGEVADNQSFTLSWGHTNKQGSGTYSFQYACVENLSFSVNGNSVACNTPTLVGDVTSLALTANSTVTPVTNATLTIGFIPEGSSVPVTSQSTTIRVSYTAPTTGTGNTGTNTGTGTTPPPAFGPSDPNGFTDLSVRITAIGVVNRNTNTFFPLINPSRSSLTDRIAVRFEVKNEGTRTSPQWFFRANLPTTQNPVFNSGAQAGLRPGESIIYTLAFDGFINAFQGVVSISVDPAQVIVEPNENNNFASQTITTVP